MGLCGESRSFRLNRETADLQMFHGKPLVSGFCSTWNTLNRKASSRGHLPFPVRLVSPILFHVEHFGLQGLIPRFPAPSGPPSLRILFHVEHFKPLGPIPRVPAPPSPP